MTPARLRWGMILVQIGILILLVQVDVIDYNFIWGLLAAFPLFLIAVGVEKIFTGSRLQVISYLAVLTLFGGGIYFAVQGSQEGAFSNFFKRTTFRQAVDPSVKVLNAEVRLDGNGLRIRDASSDLVSARFAKYTHKPRIKYDVDGEEATVKITSRLGRLFGGAIVIDTDIDEDWTLYFSREVPLNLDCRGDEADIHLNLATTPLRELKLDAEKSDVYLKLGDLEPLVAVKLKGVDSDLRLRLPTEAGVRIAAPEFRDYLSRLGFIELDEYFVSDGYDTLGNKIDIELGDEFDNLKIEYY